MKNIWFKVIAIFILVVIVLTFVFGFFYADETKVFVSEKIGVYGYVAFFLIGFFIDSTVNYISPHTLFISSALFGYGMFYSILFVSLGSIVGSIAGYEVSKVFGIRIMSKNIGADKINGMKKIMNSRGRWGLFIAAISPLPYFPILIGALGVSRKNFFIFGVIPRTLGLILSGLIVYRIF